MCTIYLPIERGLGAGLINKQIVYTKKQITDIVHSSELNAENLRFY